MPLPKLSPTQKLAVRGHIADYCEAAEANRLRWHYTQARPFGGFGVPPSRYHANDCSGYVSLAFDWAQDRAGVKLADPLGENYSGWGYTGTLLEFLDAYPAPEGRYLVGDIAIFGTRNRTTHTSICRLDGSKATAIFSSNGHEAAAFGYDSPNPTKLATYPLSLIGVYRHPRLR